MQRSFLTRVRGNLSWRLQQGMQAPRRTTAFLFGTLWHDLVLARSIRRHSGADPAGPRVCIYTIFPTSGVQQSHIDTLQAAICAGYSPLVVSNHSLTVADIARLTPISWQIIERPNFGYDFGAYRTGILATWALRDNLTDLVLLNDSIWFPVGAHNWFTQATGAKQDLVAAVANYGIRFTPPDGWVYDPMAPRLHYCSFALRFGPALLRAPEFWQFWKGFRLSNDKITTVQRGELGFSRWVIEAGFSHSSTYPIDQIPQALAHKSPAQLRDLLADLIIPEDRDLRRKRDELLKTDAATETDLRSFILDAIEQTGPAYAAPGLAVTELGVSFLKKSPLWLDEAGAAVTLKRLEAHAPAYLPEAHTLRRARGLPKQPEP